jgi:phospholipid/cholesterol/gamma-HCH transport system substrate-binding protein
MQKYSKETLVGIFVLVGLACIGYMTVKLGDVSLFQDDTYPLTARFSKVTGLRNGSIVNMLGLEIGRVGKLTIDQEKQQAVAELRIQKGIKIYDDAIASIKTEGIIGDRYVSVDPGGGGTLLKGGDAILETEAPADLMDLVSKYAFGDVKK